MLKRMVIGLPRSGTTWAANWLSCGTELTVHDPLYHTHYSQWKRHPDFTGVSCTGIRNWPEFVRAQTCPILILHRPQAEVEASMRAFSPEYSEWLAPDAESCLLDLERPGVMVVNWRDLFHPFAASRIWRRLHMPSPFSEQRHRELVGMRIQPTAPLPTGIDHELHARLMLELREKRENDTRAA